MRTTIFVLSSVASACVCVRADDTPPPIYAKDHAGVEVEWIQRIWCADEHNAFPDIERFKNRWYVAMREGTAHGISGFGRVRVISSADGKQWKSVAVFGDDGDYRRPELSVTPDGRLMVVTKFNFYEKAAADEKRVIEARDRKGKVHRVVSRRYENRVAFSADGDRFGDIEPVTGTHEKAWFYSGVQWYEGTGYAIDRKGRALYSTRDGEDFQKVSEVPVGNESRIGFHADGTMVVFFRNGSLATSQPPYNRWSVNEHNRKGPHSFGGPGIVVSPGGDVWTASRHRIDPNDFAFPRGENEFPDGTVLFKLQGDTLVPKLLIRGGGDRGYNGLVLHEGYLWMVYNAPSKELRKSCIYLSKIAI